MTAPKKTPAKRSPAKRAPAKPDAEAVVPTDQGTSVPTDEAQAQDAPPSTEAAQAVEPTAGEESAAADAADSEVKASEALQEVTAELSVPDDDEDGEMEIEGIWVTSKPKSFRRAGYRFTQEGFGIALHALQEGELEMLESEPNLVVERVTFTDVPLTKPKAE